VRLAKPALFFDNFRDSVVEIINIALVIIATFCTMRRKQCAIRHYNKTSYKQGSAASATAVHTFRNLHVVVTEIVFRQGYYAEPSFSALPNLGVCCYSVQFLFIQFLCGAS
jgi:hypothetical protein